ncbi:MAG: putative DNA binding domain-containing protein [Anaerolineae bacterium]|jgi:ATP-dependent DNA helicase RecG|nr:putative DNA binding domain-containing protein [Anaerolineae bacterium]
MIYPDLITKGQGARVAFIENMDAKQIAETMVAFSNSEGGTLVIGLKENGEYATSKADAEGLAKALQEAEELFSPAVVVGTWEELDTLNWGDDIREIPPDQKLYALKIPRSTELHALSDGRVLIRSGAKNRPLGGEEIARLVSAKSSGDYESEVIPHVTKDHFSKKMLDAYLEKRAERTKRPHTGNLDDLLKEIGALNPDGKPTMCGILLFCEYPQQWIPQSSVVFAKFLGKNPRGESGLAGYIRREELTGPLPRLIESAWNLIWSEMAVSAVVKGLEREETYEYPQFAVREAIVNAICHRDYRLKGRRIEIRMYSDRLEVISPGSLPAFITIENIKDEHFSRNPRMVNGLFQWGYIEELGLGIDRMMEVMKQAGHPSPDFDAHPHSFAVTLYNTRDKQNKVTLSVDANRESNHRQNLALDYIGKNGSITNREYRNICEGVSSETLRLDLVDMVERGLIVKVGSKKGTYYILK